LFIERKKYLLNFEQYKTQFDREKSEQWSKMQLAAAKKQAEAKENNATAKAMSLAAGENHEEFRE